MTGGISEVYGKLDGMGLAALVKKGEVSASEVLEEAIRRAEAVNGTLNFLTYKAYEEGRKMAADPALPDGPFRGVPWLVKEIATDWEGLQNTNACPYFKDVVSTSDNEQVKRVKQAGFVLLGKSNSPEAGWALSTEPKMYGPTVNPWDTTRTPGGSSGGSAAAVAARVLPLSRSERRRRLHPHAGVPLRPRRPQARTRAHHDGAGCRLLVRRRDLPLCLAQRARHGRLFRCRRRPHAGRSLLRGHAGHPLPR